MNSHGKSPGDSIPINQDERRRERAASADNKQVSKVRREGWAAREEVTEEVEQVATVGVAAGGAAEEGLSVGEVPRGVREVVGHGEQEVAGIRERVPETEHPVEADAPSSRSRFRRRRRRQHH